MERSILNMVLTVLCGLVFPTAIAGEVGRADFDVRAEYYDAGRSFTPRDSASLDSLIRCRMAENHIPGVATIALKDGEVLWNQCYGYAILEDSVPVADSTLFYMASISKTVVAVALMQLWEHGALDLDDDVGMLLGFPVRNPYYPDSVISIRMCMTHISSINDNFDILGPLNIVGDSPIPLGEFLGEYLVPGGIYYDANNYNPWPPAAQNDYSNIGAAICGYIVERLVDSFPVMCRDSLFNPLSMDETSWFLAELNIDNIAMPYYWDGSAHIPYGHIGKPYYPCGTLRTNSRSIDRYLTAVMKYGVIDDTVRILDSATVALMTTIQYPALNPEQGLFWYKKYLDGRWIWGHQGWSHGARTRIAFDWSNNTGAVVLTNGEDINSVTEIMLNLLNYAGQVAIAESKIVIPVPAVRLYPNEPNPFRKSTNIRFVLQTAEHVTLKFFNAAGQEIATLVDAKLQPGAHNFVLDAGDLPTGVYYCRLATGQQNQTISCVLLR